MAESTVQHLLRQGDYGTILTAINDVEEYIERKEIKFPRLVVFGDESAGKSSLMEAICNVPFPKGGQLMTRAVMNVRLRRGPKRIRVWSTYRDTNLPQNVHVVEDEEELEDVILRRQQKEIESQNEVLFPGERRVFAENAITIEICDEGNPDLTLVDLPGYFQNKASDDKRGTSEDLSFIQDVLRAYLEDASSILLIVVAANVNLKTVNVLNFIEKFEEKLSSQEKLNLKERTIYCLTKCDLVDGKPKKQEPPQDIKELMSNKGHVKAVPHGWFAVVNDLSDTSRSRREKLEKDREAEEKFFERTEPYDKFEDQCGIPKLVLKLTKVLENEITQSIPRIRPQVDMKISAFEKQRDELGPVQRTHNRDRGLNQIVNDIKKHFEEATYGQTQSLFKDAEKKSLDLKEGDYEKCKLSRLRSERIKVFKQAIHSLRPAVDDNSGEDSQEFRKWVEDKMADAVDGVLEEALPNKTVPVDVLRDMAQKWRELAEQMYHDIAQKAESCLNIIIEVNAGQYKNLPKILRKLANLVIEEQEDAALTRLMWHYVDEVGRPDTMNEQFMEKLKSLEPTGLGYDIESTCDTYIKVFTSIFPVIENRFIDNAVRTVTTHIFDVPVDYSSLRNERAGEFKFKFTPFDVRNFVPNEIHELGEESIKDYLFELKDDREKKFKLLEKKIQRLKNLRSALNSKPTVFREPQPVVDDASFASNSFMNGIQSHIHGYED